MKMDVAKPDVSDWLIGIAKTLILGGIVGSSVDDASHKSGGYTVDELESFVESTELHKLATKWVAMAITVNWDRAGAECKTSNELWQDLIYTLNSGCYAIGRKLRNNMSVDEIIAEFE